ncbi:hypothetical protein B6D51_22460 [Pseudomonas chlororaphis subsp. chlororaphis]|nr:hypothetical protein C4K27_4180 [Pseudomonas chlororaphis subsp. chlororaphis]ORM45981.1 hypothetical protein B6D51_22460 [Pseudomonas chlororaphis subsp. chlororaphis]SMQ08857.1 hypothetical protein SAMN04488482_4064 [Pseudomonas chlororaphis]
MEWLTILSEFVFYWVGLKTLQLLTCRRFDDKKGTRFWIGLVGLFVIVAVCAMLIYLWKML